MGKAERPKMNAIMYRRIEEDVTNLYIELELTVPINPFDIAKRLGYIVTRLSEVEYAKDVLEILNTKVGDRKDGLSYYDKDLDTYVIVVNDIGVRCEERNNFTVMHEIGHIRLGHKASSLLAEMMANYYAAYALAPSVLMDYHDCDDFVDVMNIFGVSDQCAWYCFKRYNNWIGVFTFHEDEKRLVEYYKNKKENV